MAYDPYYEQYQSLRSQEALTGKVQPTSPQALAQILRSNIDADKEMQMKQEQIAGNVAYQQGSLALQQRELKQKESQQTAQSIGGAANWALGAPTALKTFGIIGGEPALGAATPAGGAPTAFAPFGEAVGSGAELTAAPGTGAAIGEAAGLAGTESGAAALAGSEVAAGTAVAESGGTAAAAAAGLAGSEAGAAALAGGEAAAGAAAAEAGGTAVAEAAAGELTADAAASLGVEELLPVLLVLVWVLCSELVRQGKLAQSIVDDEWTHVQSFLTIREYLGYRIIADPLVKLMQRSTVFTWMIAPFIRAFAYEMASKVNPEISGNKLGSFILWVGLPLCRMAYDLKYKGVVGVQRG